MPRQQRPPKNPAGASYKPYRSTAPTSVNPTLAGTTRQGDLTHPASRAESVSISGSSSVPGPPMSPSIWPNPNDSNDAKTYEGFQDLLHLDADLVTIDGKIVVRGLVKDWQVTVTTSVDSEEYHVEVGYMIGSSFAITIPLKIRAIPEGLQAHLEDTMPRDWIIKWSSKAANKKQEDLRDKAIELCIKACAEQQKIKEAASTVEVEAPEADAVPQR